MSDFNSDFNMEAAQEPQVPAAVKEPEVEALTADQEYEKYPQLQSSEIQNILADLMFAGKGEFNSMLLTEKLAFLSKRASDEHDEMLRRKSSSVLRGKGSNFAR